MNPAPLDDVSASLPPRLREHLTRELDPGEKMLWCGRPDHARVFRQGLSPAFALSLLFLGGGAVMVLRGIVTWQMLHQIPTWSFILNGPPAGMSEFWFFVVFGGVFVTIGSAILSLPFIQSARARRTVYALTPTRILTIRISRRGLPRVEALEPGHPLHLLRQDYSGGRGDIFVYPRDRGTHATLTLTGIDNARAVERRIRATFDPGVPKA